MEKCLMVIKIKEDFAKEYVAIHEKPWLEMLKAIKSAGFVNELIWFYENQSIIYFEVENFQESDKKLRETQICKEWDLTVCPWFAGEPKMLGGAIFDLNKLLG